MTRHDITMTVNGTAETLSAEARTLLVHALRDDLGYTGPKVGCERGKCGACTVHLDGEAVKACTLLAVQADGREVTTVEGLTEPTEDADLHPVQRHLHEEHGLQCGYCTPGMVMATTAFLDGEPNPDEAAIRRALKGDICRCTGYQNIVAAVAAAAEESEGGD